MEEGGGSVRKEREGVLLLCFVLFCFVSMVYGRGLKFRWEKGEESPRYVC